MIPNSSIDTIYGKLIGELGFLAIAKGNLLGNLDLLNKRQKMHTFFAFNGQSETGKSCNSGNDRCYTWDDTIIDCRHAPGLIDSEKLEEWIEAIEENPKFKKFKKELEEKMGECVKVTPFYKTLHGKENMRYNIRLDSKIEDFDSIRAGIRIKAEDDAYFKKGLALLKESENPFHIKAHPLEKDLKV